MVAKLKVFSLIGDTFFKKTKTYWWLWWRSKGCDLQTVLQLGELWLSDWWLSEDSPRKPTTGTVLTLAELPFLQICTYMLRRHVPFLPLSSLGAHFIPGPWDVLFPWYFVLERLSCRHAQSRYDSSVRVHLHCSLFFCLPLFFFSFCTRPVRTQNKYILYHRKWKSGLIPGTRLQIISVKYLHLICICICIYTRVRTVSYTGTRYCIVSLRVRDAAVL